MVKMKRLTSAIFLLLFPIHLHADAGAFDTDRWYKMLDDVRSRAVSENISTETIDATLKSPAFIPSIVRSDKNQSEFKLTLSGYLDRTVSPKRIKHGRGMRAKYPTMLSRVENMYGVQPHVILAFWGMESNFGDVKARHKLTDAFLTLMYNGRRETFFTKQLLALMKIADKNHLDINSIYGSWAGAMGHFQFIPTTLSQYGVDGNGDGRIDIINNISDAMCSAGNYLHKLGWNPNEEIALRVLIPTDFDSDVLSGDKKYSITQWKSMGVLNADGVPLLDNEAVVGLVGGTGNNDKTNFVISSDNDVEMTTMKVAYLTYPNFYRIKRWNNSNWYAIAIAELSDKLKNLHNAIHPCPICGNLSDTPEQGVCSIFL